MTAAHSENAARDLLRRLIEEAELEAAPIDEVRADLALLNVDPARSIRFSLRLAEDASTPASGLLVKSLAAEDSDREIAALESAQIDAVRAELSAASPLGASQAQRFANRIATAPSPPRRSTRRLWYGIAGAGFAIAASLLIVVGLTSTDDNLQVAFAPNAALAPAAPDKLEQEAARAAPVPPASPAKTAGASSSGAVPVSTGENASPDFDGSVVGGHDGQAAAKSGPTKNLGGGTDSDVFGSGGLPLEGALQQPSVAEDVSSPIVADGAGDFTVTAALILQPEHAPEPLRQSDLSEGGLKSRLPEAARFVARQSIVALITLKRAGGTTVDAMLLRIRVGYLRYSDAADPDLDAEASGLSEPTPAAPTLRQLLGKDIDEFLLIELKPPAAAKQN